LAEAIGKDFVASDRAVGSDDNSLVRRCQKGDTAAMQTLILRYQNRIYNVILKICANSADALELTQETFVKIIEKIKDFEYRSGFYTWAFRIAVNLTITHCKKKARMGSISIDESSGDNPETRSAMLQFMHESSVADPAIISQNAELCQLVMKMLSRLSDEHKTVLILRDIEGMDYARIAQVLNIEPGTVKSRISRARGCLKELLESAL
jgi:RNA polymerase sigma-70 factor (ECF subfamily)